MSYGGITFSADLGGLAITQVRSLRANEEKGFARMANERELAGPKRLGKPLK